MKETKSRSQLLPHSLDAELAILGTLLTYPSLGVEIGDKLQSRYFFLESHQIVVQTMVELILENIPPDLINVIERLRYKNEHEKVGDLEGLRHFLQSSSHPENLPFWLHEVKKYWELRTVVDKCAQISAKGKQIAGANIDAFLQEVEQTFLELAESRVTKGLVSSAEVVRETILQLEKVMLNPNQGVTGVPSGFVDLDAITAGFQPSDLIIVAARPAMGKTAFALNIATNAALRADKRTAFFSLEMSSTQLMQRLLATAARIHSHHFRDGKMTAEDLQRLYPEAAALQTDRLWFDDTPALSLVELGSRLRKVKREKGQVDLVVIDYLQLMTVGGAAQSKAVASREREVSIISMGLKALAKELACPIIALAQLNRGLEQRPDKRPKPADLRESGSLEQDADQIMFLYRDEVYNKDTTDKGIAEVIIGKNRHGSLSTVKLAFQSEFTSFHNLAQV